MNNNAPPELTIAIWSSQGQDAEFAAIHGALCVYLDHPPLMTDHYQCSQLPRKGKPNEYTLLYRKTALGIIRKVFSAAQPKPIKVSFTPLPLLN